jgi:DNA-binding CsgD family transcriptional regulator
VFDEGAELADRTGFGWSWWGIAMRGKQLSVRYEAGEWDDCERLAAAIPDLAPPLAIAELGAAALWVEVGRGRTTVPKRLRGPTALTTLNATTDVEVDVGGLEADHAIWQGDLDRAMSAVRHALATIDARETRTFHDDVWISAVGLAVQAERAERMRAAGDAAALNDAEAVGQRLLDRVREAIDQAHRLGLAHDVHLRGFHAKAEAEWTRLQANSNPEAWQTAVEAFSWGHVYEVARCRWRLAEALLGVGDREQATAAARSAYESALRLGAEPLRGAMEALARRGRLDLGVGLPPERTLAGLTPREVEVLRLLVQGRSNRQIAEQLFISGKTASVHVTHILDKLGVHSRLEAAATARRLGLDQPTQHGSAT